MPDRPDALELLEAVTEFLAGRGPADAHGSSAEVPDAGRANALGIAYRELTSNTVLLGEEELAELARRIRAGDSAAGRVPRAEGSTSRPSFAISNPAALERY